MLKPLLSLTTFCLSLVSMSTSPLGASTLIEKEEILDINYTDTSQLVNKVIPIYELSDLSELSNGFLTSKPIFIKFKINENIEVLDAFNNNLGDFSKFYESYIEGKYLPLIEIDNDEIALSYLDYISNNYYVKDLGIYSNDIRIFKEFSENNKLNKNYFIYDITNFNLLDLADIHKIINISNIYGINSFTIDSHFKDLDKIINEFNEFNKVIFTKNNVDLYDYFKSITSGSSGIITSSLNDLNSALSKFNKLGNTKEQFLASHRGLVTSGINENSLSSIRLADTLNSTYVEIDLQITKDHEIVICHNNELNVTTDCKDNSKITQSSLSKVKSFNLIDNETSVNEKIPTLKEVFSEFKDSDLIFILEFKFDGGFATYPLDVAKYVNEIVKEYDMEDKVIGITFFKGYYDSINKYMPYMTTMYLGAPNGENEFSNLSDLEKTLKFFKKYNTSLDLGYSADLKNHYFNMISRGYFLNSYTFNDPSSLKEPLNIATTDDYYDSSNLIKSIRSDKDFYVINSLDELESNLVTSATKYNGEVLSNFKDYEIIYLEGNESSSTLTLSLYYYDETNDYGLYSNVFKVNLLDNGGNKENNYKEIVGEDGVYFNLDNYEETITSLKAPSNNKLEIILLATLIPLGILLIGITIFIIIKNIHKLRNKT